MAEAPGAAQADTETRVGKWLAANAGARPLTEDELRRYKAKGARCGWRLNVAILDQPTTLDLVFDARFPRSRPSVALTQPPAFPSYPHVEEDGRLCIVEDSDELDHSQPIGIVKAVLGGAVEILERGMAGTNRAEFQSEFLSYWNPTAKGDLIRSLVDPCGDTRRVRLWRSKAGYFVAEDRAALNAWLTNRAGKGLQRDAECASALLLWFDQPLLTSDYPNTPDDVRTLAARLGEPASATLDAFLGHEQQDWVILLGAEADNGPCFAAVTIKPRKRHGRGGPKGTKGFRKGKAPPAVVLEQARHGLLARHRVGRADPWWIHGRDGNADLTTLRTSRVVMVGCGSLGSPIARLLAQAGVAEIDLIDPDRMELENTSRHALGASQNGLNKATALAQWLQRDFPHSRATGHPSGWQKLAVERPEIFGQADLVVSTIGSWSHEAELNARQLETGHLATILYAWAEPHAAAGHAVLIGRTGGCFACGLSPSGEALFRAVEFAAPTLQREAACGNYFQPYGAPQINAIASIAADLALDRLLGRADGGTYRVVSGREAAIFRAGGAWTENWRAATQNRPSATLVERVWRHNPVCPTCGKSDR
ncbi:ThiF family adenylyltransferase [Parablastomonas sp. CN1-191]|uniref:ThiF family adenylyltransferase n=1 Tax=Parablastomonas sp. CN1-191 TaxID=3400908 RepID=UPI003BF7F955